MTYRRPVKDTGGCINVDDVGTPVQESWTGYPAAGKPIEAWKTVIRKNPSGKFGLLVPGHLDSS